jgi:hypothetical protein
MWDRLTVGGSSLSPTPQSPPLSAAAELTQATITPYFKLQLLHAAKRKLQIPCSWKVRPTLHSWHDIATNRDSRRITTTANQSEVNQNEHGTPNTRTAAHKYFLGGCSRVGLIESTESGSAREELARAHQPDLTRNTFACPELLRQKRHGSRPNHVDPRMSWLERGVHRAFLVVGPLGLQEHP